MRSCSGQLSDDRRECVGHVGAEDVVGEADLLRSPLDSSAAAAASSRRIGQRVRRTQRSRVLSGGAMNGATRSRPIVMAVPRQKAQALAAEARTG